MSPTRLSGNGDYDYPAIDNEPDEPDFDEEQHRENFDEFMDPGGNSALRAGKRNRPCPTCKSPNRLTAADVELGYQCDTCADKAERGVD